MGSSGFMVAMTVSMLTTPWLLARFGYRRTYDGTMVLLLVRRHRRRAGPWFPLVLAARVAGGWPRAWCSRSPPSS